MLVPEVALGRAVPRCSSHPGRRGQHRRGMQLQQENAATWHSRPAAQVQWIDGEQQQELMAARQSSRCGREPGTLCWCRQSKQ